MLILVFNYLFNSPPCLIADFTGFGKCPTTSSKYVFTFGTTGFDAD
ncbi:hypothetical protein CWATWH0402_564 [Crocosphaera watsonii WH 0402]|uniref:Uncharacterized protein n=1 Tax=Crocosphaera watsonii WH 0402 TaxID=1284629 RepID=T2JYI2_CROWT|nr:hypothetical protein CWATWH0402_564 [Crocosphaera watsonii WH 0402]